MARGKQLQQLVFGVRAEVRRSTSVAAGVDDLPALKQMIARTQETLYDEHEWDFFKVKPYMTLNAGQRYYDMPATLNFDRISKAVVWWNGAPLEITRGIDETEYADTNSNVDERRDPVLKWDLVWTGSATQVEVWPIPASNGLSLQWFGFRPLNPLVSDSDVADLDDHLIQLFVASEILAAAGAKDAQNKLAAAQARFNRLKGNARAGFKPVVLGSGPQSPRRQGTIIRVSG